MLRSKHAIEIRLLLPLLISVFKDASKQYSYMLSNLSTLKLLNKDKVCALYWAFAIEHNAFFL